MLCFIERDADANHQSKVYCIQIRLCKYESAFQEDIRTVWCDGEIVRLLSPQEIIRVPFLTRDTADDHTCALVDNIRATVCIDFSIADGLLGVSLPR